MKKSLTIEATSNQNPTVMNKSPDRTEGPDAHEIAYYAVRGTNRDPVEDVAEVEEMIKQFAKSNANTPNIVGMLHEKAKHLEKQGLIQGKAGNTHAMHQVMDTARCFRVCANYLDGNQAG